MRLRQNLRKHSIGLEKKELSACKKPMPPTVTRVSKGDRGPIDGSQILGKVIRIEQPDAEVQSEGAPSD